MKNDSKDEMKGMERCKPKEEKWSRRKERLKYKKGKRNSHILMNKNKENLIGK